jgi:sn1-specific diacylglycerol lipase
VVIKRLVIVGHSLGAGTAAVLGVLMKEEYPTLKVYGYGTPGSVLDERTAKEVGSYLTSCILGDDVVGSLSFHSLHAVREQVLSPSLSSSLNSPLSSLTLLLLSSALLCCSPSGA